MATAAPDSSGRGEESTLPLNACRGSTTGSAGAAPTQRARRRAQLQGRVPGRPRELHADRGLHLQHRAHGRRLR
jgi:hypothetical protein